MNELLKNNLVFLKNLKVYADLLKMFKIEGDTLIINDFKVDLKDVKLEEVLNTNTLNNSSNLTAEDIINLFKISLKKKEVLPPTENINETLNKNPKIKNFKVIKKYWEDGSYLEYPYYIDEANNIHVLFNYAGTNILGVYQDLYLKQGGNVTGKDLYDALNRRMKNVELRPDYESENNAREGTKLETNIVNKENKQERVHTNNEHGIYQMGNNIYTFGVDAGLNKNTISNSEQSESQENEANYEDKFDQDSLKVQENTTKEATLISESEYYLLIKYANPEEKPEIGLFESFLEDVLYYESYVSEDLKALVNRYQNFMINLEISKEATNYEMEALKRYKNILDKIDTRVNELTKENALIRTRKLKEEYDKVGFTLISVIFIGVIIVTIISIYLFLKA